MAQDYIHDDALGGANVLSNASGTLAEVIEYYPFGGIRLDQRATSTPFGEQRRFTGHEFDTGTGLNYMDARYEAPTLSRFLSEDPKFIAAGGDLKNPQTLNAYSYARNNPIVFFDPTGLDSVFFGAQSIGAPFGGSPFNGEHTYGYFNIDTPGEAQELGIPGLVAGSNGNTSFTISFEPSGNWGKPMIMQIGTGSNGSKDYLDATRNGGSKGHMDISPVPYKNTAQLANGFYKSASTINDAQLPYFPVPRVAGWNYYGVNSNMGLNTVARQNGQGAAYQNFMQQLMRGGGNPAGGGGYISLPPVVVQNGLTYVRNASGLLNFANPSMSTSISTPSRQ